MNDLAWDRTGCRERVCWCHDDTIEPINCSGCGCQRAAPGLVIARREDRAIRSARALLGEARQHLKTAGAIRAAYAVKCALQSVDGALRHAHRRAYSGVQRRIRRLNRRQRNRACPAAHA